MTSEEYLPELTKRIGYKTTDIKLLLTRMKIVSRRDQLPKKNLYSSKHCECCGPYHGTCDLKVQYWIDMEEYEIYPEDQSDFECDGCKQIRKEYDYEDDYYIFTGQNPKIDCPHFRICQYCQGTGVYINQLFETLGSIDHQMQENGNDGFESELTNAVFHYWRGGRNYSETDLRCMYDSYISESKYCPFCHGEGYLADPIEALLVSYFANYLMEYDNYEPAGQSLKALDLWQFMKSQRRFFHSDFVYFEKLDHDMYKDRLSKISWFGRNEEAAE